MSWSDKYPEYNQRMEEITKSCMYWFNGNNCGLTLA